MDSNNAFAWGLTSEQQDENLLNDSERKQFQSLQKSYIETFNTDHGRVVLEDLMQFLSLPVADPGSSPQWAFFREGQNDLVRRITNLIGGPENVKRQSKPKRKSKPGSKSK